MPQAESTPEEGTGAAKSPNSTSATTGPNKDQPQSGTPTGETTLDKSPTTNQIVDSLSKSTLTEVLTADTSLPSNEQDLRNALRKLAPAEILDTLAASGKTKSMADYKFWSTQPVPRFDEPSMTAGSDESASTQPKAALKEFKEGPIQVKDKSETPTSPASLVEGFEWSEMDLMDEVILEEVRDLLCNHYVEDKESMFRFDYGFGTLNWALKAPGWRSKWHVGVRASKSRKLVAFISAIPVKLRVRTNSFEGSEVNFICVHKKLRSKRLAPVLITEITRRCNLEGIFQAIYTAGVLLPRPVSICRYYHRSLDWEKLFAIGFSSMPPNSTKFRQIAKYKLPEKTLLKGLRLMEKKDVGVVGKLLKAYLDRMKLAQVFNDEEVAHWLLDDETDPLSPKRVVWTYVVETGGKVTDFFSFYRLNSTVIKRSGGEDTVRVAYLFYYGTEDATATQEDNQTLKARLNEMIKDALILAKRANFDVFNAVSLLDNPLFFAEQKFEPGDGRLHYYLYNYRTADIANGLDADDKADVHNTGGIGVVML